ncbi:helix-turn-helix transcriptional regulator [Nakamurella lactea]|uniref:helix-turn-helix transcriptional regulator n=1 Tax=Nakamurella lactea TaxID=459515 RepID=UPI0004271C37|nr:helix-turn-helix transcriptional regulator [Nakamurella lactea]
MAGQTSANSRRELGDFLRTRRERLSPERAGIPAGGRRRTPGLRREEVAALAGVGVTWYTWLEQGRPINASAQVLGAIVRTLRLTSTEEHHLWTLAGVTPPGPPPEPFPTISSGARKVIAQLDPYPACVQNARFDVLAYNRAYRFLFGDMDTRAPQERNCVRLMFTDRDWRAHYLDPDIVAGRMVAKLRAAMGGRIDDPRFVELVDELRTSSTEFDRLWREHDVLNREYPTKRIRQSEVGEMHLEFVWTAMDDVGELRMSVMTPVDAATEQRLYQLAEITAGLPDVEFSAGSS